MRYSLYVNQVKAIELGIENINQAIVFDLLANASSWAQDQIIDNEVYYWIARQQVCTQLPFLKMKPDTAYRHYKALSVLGLIDYRKHGQKDCIRVTPLGKTYMQDMPVLPENKIRKSTLFKPDWAKSKKFDDAFSEIMKENEINPTPKILKMTKDTFVDYWCSGDTVKFKKADWLATWRNWVRSDITKNGWRYRKDQQVAGNSIMPENDMELPSDDNLLQKWAESHGAPMPESAADYTYDKYRADLKTWVSRNYKNKEAT